MANQKKNDLDSSYFLSEFYCKLSIKGVEILPQNITVINIRESIFDLIPLLDLSFIDDGTFVEKFPLEDGDIIAVELARSDLTGVPISMEFILHDFSIDNKDGDNIQLADINLTGVMKNKEMFAPVKTRSFSNKTSVDVIKSIASDCGFEPSIKVSTSDSMIWRQITQSNFTMIKDTMKRAFKSEDAILTGITRNKQFIITSLKTITNNKSKKTASFDAVNAVSDNIKDGEKKEIIYFNNFNIKNIDGMINNTIAYGMSYAFYDFEKTTKKKIISDFHPLTEFSYKNKNNIGKIVDNTSINILNGLNVHKNYFVALAQNEFYNKDFFKNCLIIYTNPTDNLNIFDKINVVFPSFGDQFSINQTLSGEYIVGTILHQASKSGHYVMVVTLFRNGMNGSPYMKKSEYKVS